uniref:Transmembrane protein 115 n=2 Tax=Caenorhabditis japonica TaxID=281687 RepID=A0A8R1HR43_CAEJA
MRNHQIMRKNLWRFFTSSFCGHNVLDVLWTAWCLHFGTNLVRLNNTNESLLVLYAITQAVTSIIIVVLAYFTYLFFDSIKLFYIEPVVGLAPVNAAVMVLMKQFLPDTIVIGTPFGRIKYAHLPFLAICISFILAVTKFIYFLSFLQIAIGVQVSWTYLRFYKPHETDEIYGDGSDHFTWASLFPSRSQLFFTLIGKVCFRTLAKLGVCKRQVRHVDFNSLQSVNVEINLAAVEKSAKEDEKKRQKALKELNERLNKTRSSQAASYGNWDDEDEPNVVVTSPSVVETSNVHSPLPVVFQETENKESMA